MKKSLLLVIYKAKDGWRWRLKAGNNRIIADSAEAYVTKQSAGRSANILIDAPWFDLEIQE